MDYGTIFLLLWIGFSVYCLWSLNRWIDRTF
jgi:hypothetical protein